jgi:MFS family permease
MAKLPLSSPNLPPAPLSARPSRWPQTFRSLRHRNYRLWFFGQGLSLIGTWMQTVAQQVLLYRLTGSAAALGLASFIGLIPLVPLALWGGSMADRFSKRRVLLITQAAMLAQALALALLTFSDAVQVWQVYALTLALGAAQAIDIPVRLAFTAEMVGVAGDEAANREDLTNAIGLNAAIFNAARAVGPALAGLTVAAVGESVAFLINGLSFAPVIVSLLLMRGLPAVERSTLGAIGVAHHTAAGVRFVLQQRTLLILVSLVAVSALLAMPFNTLMPVFAGGDLAASAQPVG